ncbi:MAG TPA: type II toxin-antitoxin system VapC family toxin [Blastocatellia bacterium]|nr:type II toxin-antitoxin system VapC family toxin [Blastocatellia bacterium]
MAIYFLDSSAVVKRYGNEAGTIWVRNLTHPLSSNRIYIARITAVEVISAITRKMRSGGATAANAFAAINQFRRHLTQEYVSVDITPEVINDAMLLAQTYALRGYDAVQLAAALDISNYLFGVNSMGLTLISADTALNSAALAEGLIVDDPNAHP